MALSLMPNLGLDGFRDGALGGGVSVTYLLRDELTTTAAAGFSSPRTAEPSPGQLRRSADTNNRGSIDNGDLYINGATNVAYADPAYYWTDDSGNGFARADGETFLVKVIPVAVTAITLSNNSTPINTTQYGVRFNSDLSITYARGGNAHVIGAFTVSTTYLVALTLRGTTGIEIRIKGGDYTQWTLLFVDTVWADATLFPACSFSGTVTTRILRVAGFNDTDDLKTNEVLSQATPVSGTIYTGTADTFCQYLVTVPAGAVGRYMELRYRVADASNYCLARIDWNNGTSQWDLVTGHVIGGVETLQGAAIANVGATTRLAVRALGNSHDFWTTGGTTWTKRYGTITDSSGASNTGIAVVQNGGFTLTTLSAWANQDATIAAALDARAA